MRKLILVAALFAGAAATPAYAQDDAAIPPGQLHVYGLAGLDILDEEDANVHGIAYAIGAGYDFSVGNEVTLGIEGEVGGATTDKCVTPIVAAADSLCIQAGRDLYVGGRVGIRISGRSNSIFFLGGGYTNAQADVIYDAGLPGTTGDVDSSDNFDGFRLKAGAEIGLGPNLFARGEYRFSSYDDGDLRRHQVLGGLGFRF